MFLSKQAIVIGPTPPGTGVIAFATLETVVNFTSPTNLLLLFSSFGNLFIPTSITIDPSLTQSFLMLKNGF